MPTSEDELRNRVEQLFANTREELAGLIIQSDPTWSIRADVKLPGRPVFTLRGAGPSAELAYADLLHNAMEGLDEIGALMRRGQAQCWVCDVRRQRTEMEATIVGGEIWWLCDRCQVRRSNAARLNLIWPTDYQTWRRRWRAEQRTEGRDDAWMDAVEVEAIARHDVDPFIVNKMQAVLQVAADR